MEVSCTICNSKRKVWPSHLKRMNIEAYQCRKCITGLSKEVRICPVCNKEFSVWRCEKKQTCSYACSNSLFRSGENNGNWKQDTYRTTCFAKHKKKCVICEESNIVEVHHYNGNHEDNRIENLVPICPTHHKYMHSRFAVLIKDTVDKYVKEFQQGMAE